MLAGDEFYDDEITSGGIAKLAAALPRAEDRPVCTWCEDWGMGMDPEPCPEHTA
jgi:hypothetical protein